MTNSDLPGYLKCAAPDCRSAARDGHVCTAHHGTLYADRTFAARVFRLTAVDPERPNYQRQFRVRALHLEQAKDAARAELAREKRDDWSISCVQPQSQASAA
jgi:hypothetical protein